MDRRLTNFNNDILKILENRQLLTKSQLAYLWIIQATRKCNIFKLIIVENIICNELLIEILTEYYGVRKLKNDRNSIKILDYSNINHYITKGYFTYITPNGEYNIVINNLKSLPKIVKSYCWSKINLVSLKDFHKFFDNSFSRLNTIKSKYYLNFISPALTAKNINYNKNILGFITVFFACLICFPGLFHIVNNIGYFTQNLLKMALFKKALKTGDKDFTRTIDIDLPVYTVLIPLYKEEEKLESIIEFVHNFNYPKYKLDVKIIVEADDYSLINKIESYKLPSYIQIIRVPYSSPRTKPKALNYAMQYCKGKYIVVYDAEDRPDPNQLLEAVHTFEALPPQYACLQAKLNFYNHDENLLTRFFSIEYSLWFDYLLKGLSIFDLPVTLGGTSNHFRTAVLKKLGGWDAYNVTEDADLGIRLYLLGYKVYVINSYTLEEAHISLGNWLNQRSRWIKGFIQTFFVFLNQKNKLSKLTIQQVISVYIFVGISSYSFYCLPWLFLMVIKNLIPIIDYLWLVNSFFAFAYIYGSAYHILISSKVELKNFQRLDFLALIFFPFYFILHSIASYKAIWESVTRPFEWNKTVHGQSNREIKQNNEMRH